MNPARDRLEALRKLLTAGELSTQEELAEKLGRLSFSVTQSTISRDLRKLGAVKAIDPSGRTVYRLNPQAEEPVAANASLREMVQNIQENGHLIVIHTTPGSASLVARHLDQVKPGGILGTLAGDDTIFVAPRSAKLVPDSIRAIEDCL